ncbi:hypothetical protein K438DRAFT_2153906 [Mycena galopus ATCC 62051]|nr:hypothetical protein K438DRAFT_2153906 [Mycena galopus ATCC 62051]
MIRERELREGETGMVPRRRAGRSFPTDENENLLLEQEAAHKASDTLLEQGLPASELPLCTIAYEVQDDSNDTWHRAKLVLLPSWPIPDGPTRRISYQFVQLVRDPVVLYLSFSHTLRGTRRIFTQPPPEILSAIFGCAVEDKMYAPWRPTLISFALVCRDWIVALEHLFHDFGTYTSGKTAPDLEAVSKAVQATPQLGEAIWRLSRSHFGRDQNYANNNEEEYLVRAIAFKNILHSTKHVRELEIFHTHSSLREEFIEALSQSSDVQTFLINSHPTPEEPKYFCHPTLPELFRCFQKWSRLHGLQLFGWEGPNPFLQTVEQFTIEQTPPLDCALRAPALQSHGGITFIPFRRQLQWNYWPFECWPEGMVASSCTCLTKLTIEKCSIAKASDNEEYAFDAAMSRLTSLCSMRLEGDILLELAVLRKPSPTGWSGSTINLDNCPGVSPHGLVQALKYTGWRTISARRLFEGNEPLLEKGKAIAKERGLSFW